MDTALAKPQTDSAATDRGAAAASVAEPVGAGRVALCIFATWLVPGAGHWMLGRRGKAMLYFSLITFLFVFGLVIGEFRVINLEHFWLHFVGQVFYGGLAIPTLLATRHLELGLSVDPGGVSLEFPFLDVGVLYVTVAGLLNLCVMVDVYETAFPRAVPPSGGESS